MRLAILGGGFTGLTAAYRLAKKGNEVILFEKEDHLGGLASGFKKLDWEWYLDQQYHHIFTSDKCFINLVKEVKESDDLFFNRPKTSIYFDLNSRLNNFIKFDSPLDLIRFPYLSFINKLRTGMVMAFLKFNPFWQHFEKVTAYTWLQKFMGKESFKILWEPLLIGKFGAEATNISMAWFWARIYKRSTSLGYIKGGFQSLAEKIGKELEEKGGEINLETEVLEIRENDKKISVKTLTKGVVKQSEFDKVICTLSSGILLKITNSLPEEYIKRIESIKHLDCLNLILVLNKQFFADNTYWLNINEASFPFLGVVEQTNFINKEHYGGSHILYIANYLPSSHNFFKLSKEELLKIFTPYLLKINPNFRESLTESYLFRGYQAQPIIPVYYSQIKPEFKTPFENLYLANMDIVYPWDRGINYAIELGEKIANLVQSAE